MTHNSCPPPAYGINTQGGMNPCFLETMETIMTCHYSGVLFRLPPSTPPPPDGQSASSMRRLRGRADAPTTSRYTQRSTRTATETERSR